MVTGPSLISETFISAPNFPLAILLGTSFEVDVGNIRTVEWLARDVPLE